MSIGIGRIYAALINYGRIPLDDVPTEYREDTKAALNDDDEDNESASEIINEEIHGAVNLDPITIKCSYNELNQDGKEVIKLGYNAIFTKDKFGILPENIKYSIKRVENIYGKYRSEVSATVDTINNAGVLIVNGYPSAIMQNGDTMLRIDLTITSDNYDPMTLVVYIESL